MAKRHIERSRPSWQTGPRMSECGHSSTRVAANMFDVAAFISMKYRNMDAAYNDGWCQTCISTAQRHSPEAVELWERRLGQRRSGNRTQTTGERVRAEIAAADMLLDANRGLHEELVGALLGEDSKPDQVPGRLAVERNERAELHCTTGPAWAWTGGPEVYALEGVTLPRWAVVNPDPARLLNDLTNAEQRRVAFANYGWDRAATELGWEVLDDSGDPYVGVLYRLPKGVLRDDFGQSMNLLYGRNASPHPGGEFQWYGLPVPKANRDLDGSVALVDTAEKAQASLWRLPVEEWRKVHVRT